MATLQKLIPPGLFTALFGAVKVSTLASFLFVSMLTGALFIYLAFYNAIVPVIEHRLSLNFDYPTDCYLDKDGPHSETRRCSFPLSNVSFLQGGSGIQLLTPGQEYSFIVTLDVPESDVNYGIGNFLVSFEIFSNEDASKLPSPTRPLRPWSKDQPSNLQFSATKSVILLYRSLLFTFFRLFTLLPLFLLGLVDQRQTLTVAFESTFTESLFAPSTYAVVVLHSRYLQFYGAQLHVAAQLRGIKYMLFAYPVMSGAIIVLMLMGLFAMVVFVSLFRRFYSSMSPPPGGVQSPPPLSPQLSISRGSSRAAIKIDRPAKNNNNNSNQLRRRRSNTMPSVTDSSVSAADIDAEVTSSGLVGEVLLPDNDKEDNESDFLPSSI